MVGYDDYKKHTSALRDTEMSMDRLCRVMDAAEEEIDSALGRSAKLQMKLVEHKNKEVSVLQQRLVTKEKEVDALKVAMASTARAVQGKLHASEATLALHRLECGDLKDEVDSLRSTSAHLQGELSTTRAHLADALARVTELEQQAEEQRLQHRAELEQLQEAVERQEKVLEKNQEEIAGIIAERDALREKLEAALAGAATAEQKRMKTREKYQRKLDEIRRQTDAYAAQLQATAEEQLQAAIERSCRKASEMSLRQELESREQLQAALMTVKSALVQATDDTRGQETHSSPMQRADSRPQVGQQEVLHGSATATAPALPSSSGKDPALDSSDSGRRRDADSTLRQEMLQNVQPSNPMGWQDIMALLQQDVITAQAP